MLLCSNSFALSSHLPSTNSREILLVWSSLTTQDPGNIHETIAALAKEGVRVSCVSLAAEVKVLHTLTEKTGGSFHVALDEDHLRQLILDFVPPPPLEQDLEPTLNGGNARRNADNLEVNGQGQGQGQDELSGGEGELLCLGFPVRVSRTGGAPNGADAHVAGVRGRHDQKTLCACHNKLRSGGYLCARCGAQICEVPTDCPVCGLTALLSTHLARSYHHLLPVPAYEAQSWSQVQARQRITPPVDRCKGCYFAFGPPPEEWEEQDQEAERVEQEWTKDTDLGVPLEAAAAGATTTTGTNAGTGGGTAAKGGDPARRGRGGNKPSGVYATSGRYMCPRCGSEFCLECDTFVHDVLHVCPGCV